MVGMRRYIKAAAKEGLGLNERVRARFLNFLRRSLRENFDFC